MSAASAALAQNAPAETAPAESATALDDIVVTGTRVIRDGYQAPTPTSVIGAQEIATRAPANLADYVNVLPSLSASTSPRNHVAAVSGGVAGVNALNLRALGANRTLILLDGQRVAASTLGGLVDINILPQALVKRVDIVTGGASAEWGSDAVAGVVNFVLDKEFTGIKGLVQGGVSTYGDAKNYNASLSVGTRFADDRGHIMISGEVAHNGGVHAIGKRKWYKGAKILTNPTYTATNGQPQLLVAEGAGFATATPGGIITSGPLRGTYFGPGGTPTQFNYGSIVSGNLMVGGDWRYADFGLSGDLDPELTRRSIFARTSYDLTDDIQIYAQGSYARATSFAEVLDQFNFANITIQPDNAFIPASIRASVTAPFTLGTLNDDLGPLVSRTRRSTRRGVIGLTGGFDALGSKWSWDVYGQKSVNRSYTEARVSITSRYNAAIDSVRAPDGRIVCRSTLTNPTNGCVPYNIMGTGVNSQAALDYVVGKAFAHTKLTQDVYAGTLRGDPFSTWAGPVSVAMGIEHRREKVSGSNDPLSTTRSYFAGNFLASFGSYHVTEGFLEAVVPLLKDSPFAQSLDINGAVRATDYSTSGYVTTWKLGLTYKPVDDITFRMTRSRDIRAPNLAELFQSAQASTTTVVDPFRGNASATAFQVTSGNLNLKPEKADTLGLGVVVQPRILPGFAASVDYYNITVNDAISTVNGAAVVNQCFLGNTAFCSQITRNASNVITSVGVVPVNVAKQVSRGIDFEASYRRPLFDGNVTVRVLATRFIKNSSADGITPKTDNVGQNGTNGSLRNPLPKWRYLATVGYDNEQFSTTVTARGFSSGVYNTSYIECTSACPTSTVANQTINNNRLPGALYFDANVTAKFTKDIEAFFNVDNIANKNPATMAFGPAIGAAPIDVNPILYDVLGRTFRAGVRFKL